MNANSYILHGLQLYLALKLFLILYFHLTCFHVYNMSLFMCYKLTLKMYPCMLTKNNLPSFCSPVCSQHVYMYQ